MTLKLEIISPEKIVYSGDVELAVIPGEEGEFGVLPKHSPLVAQLKAGQVQVFSDASGEKLVAAYDIDGGFAQTDGVTCTILSDEVKEVA